MLSWPPRNHEPCSPGKEEVSGTGGSVQGRVGALPFSNRGWRLFFDLLVGEGLWAD